MRMISRFQLVRGLALALLLGAPATTHAAEDAALSWPDLMSRRTAEYDYDIPAVGSYQLPIFQPATDGIVLGTNGRPVSLHSITRGRIVVLSFIYTRCTDPKACMRATGVLSDLQRFTRNDPMLAEKLLLITLSFDPANDTPGVMARYGRVSLGYGQGADWLFLTTRNQEDLQPLLESYGQRVDKRKKPSATGPYQHPLRVYLIDQQKQIRNIYSYGLLDPRLVITDARTLLAERHDTGSADIPVGENSSTLSAAK